MADTNLDPFAAIAKPAAQPTAPPAGGDPFASIAKAPPTSSGSGGIGDFVNDKIEGEDPDPTWAPNGLERGIEHVAGGAIKSGASLAGTLLDLGAKMDRKLIPNVVAQHPEIMKHVQDASNWLRTGSQTNGFWEGVGAIGEQALEYLGTDGLLKIVGGAGLAAEGTTAAARTAQTLKNAQQVSQTLATNPKLAGLVAIGLKATQDAAVVGGQTYLHTEDPEQAAIAAGTGGAVRAGGEALGAAGRWVNKVRPKSVSIAGEEIPALASQVNENGKPIATGAGAAPAIAEAQQKAAPKVVENIAQDAARSSLERVNSTRPVYAATQEPGRMLEAPEGSEPFVFTLEGTGTTETPTGDIAHPAGKVKQPAAFPPKYTTASGPKPIEGSVGTTGADVSTAEPPEPRGENVAGAGNLQTTDPHEAEAWLRQLEEIQQKPEFSSFSKARQSAIEQQAQQLSEQLGLYHASPYAQRFAPLDVDAAVNQVRSFGDAADQIQASVKPVYSELDRASQGEFDQNNKAAKQALKIMRSATSLDAYQNAERNYNEAIGNIDNLLTRHAGSVNRQDYQAAKLAWRDSARLNELHTVMERMTNGITLEESDQGLTRVMTGRSKQLQTYLDKGQNAEQLEQLIGKDGLLNLKQLTELMSRPGSQRSTIEVIKNVATELGRHARLGGIGGFLGGTIAHSMGGSWYEGMAAGAMAGSTARYIMHDAMVNPRIGKLVDYAVRNGVSPSVYAPLIARSIAVPAQQTEPQPEDQGGDQ